MTRKISIVSPLFVLFTLSVLPASIHADAVDITEGTLTYSQPSGTAFSLTGNDLAVNGLTSSLNPLVSLLANGTVQPGGSRLTGGSVDSQDSELLLLNPITVGGVAYSPGSSLLVLSFSSASFTAPVPNFGGFTVVAPFTITAGIIEGYPGALGVGVQLFSSFLTGQGTTVLTFLRIPAGGYQLYSQSFIFGQTVPGVTVDPIPEPATLLLLGTGIVGFIGSARKRLVKKQSD